ncbi:MAG: hypothetical protein NTU84_00670 [Verrucomicrobia bacterium]|nr:hypothetical protein [Verrucomicrobiota bacterium]
MAAVANAAAAAHFEDSANIFAPNASGDGKAPATHCVCAVNATPSGEAEIRALAAQLGGTVTEFKDDPAEGWAAHNLKPVFTEKL